MSPVDKTTGGPPKSKAITANKKLELSKQDLAKIQREGMGDDLDLHKLVVHLKSRVLFDSTDRVIDIILNRSIDQATTVEVTLNDYDRTILRSGALNARLDIQIDGMWFRLVKVARNPGDDNLQLTFEQREIAILRSYPPIGALGVDYSTLPKNGVKMAKRKTEASPGTGVTRAGFILNLIREVKEFEIPVVIPELHKIQEIEKSTDVSIDWGAVAKDMGVGDGGSSDTVSSSGGIPTDVNTSQVGVESKDHTKTTRKYLVARDNQPLTKEQIKNANIILSVGSSMNATWKQMVCSIMVAIDESNIINLDHGDLDSVGVFQQRHFYGSVEDRMDVATSARMFFKACMAADKEDPTLDFNGLCQATQRSGTPYAYGQFRWMAQRIVTAFGFTGGMSAAEANAMGATDITLSSDEDYMFYRGKPKESGKVWLREDNWACITRLAEEVGWRAFFIGGVFYYMDDEDLFRTQPIGTVTESTKGITGIGFDYDIGKNGANVEIQAQVGRWMIPPGAVIVLQDMGHCDGRWLVNSYTRSLFSSNADIQLTKPKPRLPEPLDDSLTSTPTWNIQQPSSETGVTGGIDLDPSDAGKGVGADVPGDNPAVKLYNAALIIDKQRHPYIWGGGHAHAGTPDHGVSSHRDSAGTIFVAQPGFDCSGSVGAILAAAGLGYKLGQSVPGSCDMSQNWGQYGEGKYFTLWASCGSSGHVWIEFKLPPHPRQHWGTGAWGIDNPSGGPRFQKNMHFTSGFTPRHWPGL